MTNELVEKESNTDVAKVTPSHEETLERVRDLATKLHASTQVDAIRALAAEFGAEAFASMFKDVSSSCPLHARVSLVVTL